MTERPTEPRISPVDLNPDDDAGTVDPELTQILEGALTHDGTPLNIFGVLGRHPKLLKRFNLLGGFLLNKGLLPPRERELVILRIGWNAQAKYEFGQHTIIGKQCGLTDDEITAITTTTSSGPDAHLWSGDDRDLIAMADELSTDDCVTDATWARLATRWSEPELIELLIVAGFYRLVSGFLNSAGVQLDDGVPGFPTPA
jgi:4-carboxymuconolactone decarboxylase